MTPARMMISQIMIIMSNSLFCIVLQYQYRYITHTHTHTNTEWCTCMYNLLAHQWSQ